MTCAVRKIDSNVTGLSFAVEECLGQLPDPATWYSLEPNSFSDFGAELATVARSPIEPSRQQSKGTITDVTAAAGFNIDVTQNNLTRLMQGFFFAAMRELPTTLPINGTQTVITAANATGNTFTAAAGMNVFSASSLILTSGFSKPANNGLKQVSSATATTLSVTAVLDDEVPTTEAVIKEVGFHFPADDIDLIKTGDIVSLTSTTTDFTLLTKLIPGAFVYLGADTAANRFANNAGFARIGSVTANEIVFDYLTFDAVTESGEGKSIYVFFGDVIKNENTRTLIKRYSYQFERTLGEGATATQAEYIIGAVANELKINVPLSDKMTADLTFVGQNNEFRSGEAGDTIKAGSRIDAAGENGINTSSNVANLSLYVNDSTTSKPNGLFAYVSECSLEIKNGVSPAKAIGVVGAFDASTGNFVVSGSMSAYFADVAAVNAVKSNADVGFNAAFVANNAGFLFDIPLLGLGGGKVTIEKDQPVKIPLTPNAAKNKNSYTLLYQKFPYLPTLATPAV